MRTVSREERVIQKETSFDLEGVTRLFLHNRGSNTCKFGLYEIPGNGQHVLEVSNGVYKGQEVIISFPDGSGKLYMDIQRLHNCNN